MVYRRKTNLRSQSISEFNNLFLPALSFLHHKASQQLARTLASGSNFKSITYIFKIHIWTRSISTFHGIRTSIWRQWCHPWILRACSWHFRLFSTLMRSDVLLCNIVYTVQVHRSATVVALSPYRCANLLQYTVYRLNTLIRIKKCRFRLGLNSVGAQILSQTDRQSLSLF